MPDSIHFIAVAWTLVVLYSNAAIMWLSQSVQIHVCVLDHRAMINRPGKDGESVGNEEVEEK